MTLARSALVPFSSTYLHEVSGSSGPAHALDDVVAVLVREERARALVDLVEQRADVGQVLEHALEDAAAVRVRGEGEDLTLARARDEAELVRRRALEDALEHVVGVLVAGAGEDVLCEVSFGA